MAARPGKKPVVDAADLPPDVRARLRLPDPAKPRRAAMPLDEVRTYALRVMHVLADLTPAERARVLPAGASRQAQKVNDV